MKLTGGAQLLLAATADAAFTWKNVHIGGGGGFTPGIAFHPKTKGVAYARTDIGGLYRLNYADDSWTPITDTITQDATWHNWGVDALALDPQDDQVVYTAFGMYTNDWDPTNGAIGKSTDRGNTWTFSNLTFKVGGNMPGRGMGERLAVDPANSKIVYFGARSGHGLWKSTDGGATFSNVTAFKNTGTYRQTPGDTTGYANDIMGLTFVTFDSTSGTTGGATNRIFVGVADNTTASIYVSNDAGSTWAALAGQPKTYFPHKCKLQPTEKALYISYSDGIGPYDGTMGALYRYDLGNSSWTNITPVSGSSLYFGFGGIGLDMLKPGTLVVAALNSWWPNGQLFRSTNSGATWSPIWEWTSYPNMNNYYSISAAKAPWIVPGFWSSSSAEPLGWMIESLEIDPFDSDHWLYGTGLTILGGHDLTKWDTVHNVTIQSLADGIEEMSVQAVASVPGGSELLAAVGDNSGFTFATANDLTKSPSTNWITPEFSTSTGVDYAGNTPKSIVHVGNGNGSPQVALSNDGGLTWNTDYGADNTHTGGSVAISAGADTVLWSTASQGVLRSQYTNAFTSVSSLPALSVIASDKRNESYFYAGSGATFYVSSDTGSTFAKGGSLSGAAQVNYIAVHPTVAGQVYVSTDVGIFESTDFGTTFKQITSAITKVQQIALGVGSGSTWNLYAFGTGPSGNKLYGSADNGVSWTDIQGSQGFGSIGSGKLAGSGNVAGLVYVGTNGRSVFYAQGSLSGSGTSPSSSSTSSKQASSTAASSTTAPTTTTAAVSTTSTKPPTSSTTTTTTTVRPTTASTLSTKVTTTTTAGGSGPTKCSVANYGQCGGIGYTGCPSCGAGLACATQNPYYYQCVAA